MVRISADRDGTPQPTKGLVSLAHAGIHQSYCIGRAESMLAGQRVELAQHLFRGRVLAPNSVKKSKSGDGGLPGAQCTGRGELGERVVIAPFRGIHSS